MEVVVGGIISRDEIELIRRHVDMVDLVRRYHIKIVTENAKLAMALCPFHMDVHPSLAIYKEDQRFFCYSSRCKKHGDVFTWVKEMDKCTFAKAAKKLAVMYGITIK